MLGTLRVELTVGNNNGTTFKHRPKRGHGRGTRWGRYISRHVSNVVYIPVAVGRKGRSVLSLVFRSLGWYEPTEILSLTIAACTIYSNVTHIGIIFSPTNRKRGWHGHFFTGPWIGASGENVSPPAAGHQKGQKWSGVSVGKTYFPFFFLWTRRLQVLQGMSVKRFTQAFQDVTCLS